MATRLDFRPVFRRHAKRERDAYAQRIRQTKPPKRGGPPGGSIAQKIRTLKPKLKRWGYVIPYHQVGQVLTWFERGTEHQPARPVDVDTDVDGLIADLQTRAAAKLADVDRRFG